MTILVFDIETVPDTLSGRKLLGLTGLDDAEVAKTMLQHRRDETGGSDFLRHHLHRIIVISAVFASNDKVSVWSLGEKNSDETELIQRFFDGIERYTPTLVTWNGSGFDLPVLHYRALLHGVSAPRYWEIGEEDNSFRYNNYLNRYHYRHIDLMDVLSCYSARAVAPLDQIATMCGFPGKMGMDGSKVWEAYQNGDVAHIRDYCETDVLNTYLVFLRFELMRGKLTKIQYQQKCMQLRDFLEKSNLLHFTEFLNAWQQYD